MQNDRFGKGGQPLRIILQEVNKLPARINTTYLSQSNYWLTWLPLRLWAAVFDLAQVINLIWVWAKARAFGRTPREIREWTKPPKFDYAVYVSHYLFSRLWQKKADSKSPLRRLQTVCS